ncbi:MAG: DUF4056 domain-containing protein [Phycisphaerae bacterium]|nr:DUF4056 domain-containing protein [Phycisphaerae bacterium]
MSKFQISIWKTLLLGLTAGLLSGCSYYHGLRDYGGSPKLRKGAVPCISFPNKFIGPDRLGKHCYHYSLKERSGIVYTAKAGHVDIAHVRKSADWTAYLAAGCLENLLAQRTTWEFAFREPTRYVVTLEYPADWASLDNRNEIAEEVAISLGEHFAYTGTVWHEILTWFGYKSTRAVSEFASAFSWEDNFSNLLGTALAAQALGDKAHCYNEAMTLELDKALQALDVQPMKLAKQIARDARGEWYVVGFPIFMDVIKRNLDIGEDGTVQSVTYEGEGLAIPVPEKHWEHHGFRLTLEILPRGYQSKRIRKLLHADRVYPEQDFKTIMDFIEQDAHKRGYDVIR